MTKIAAVFSSRLAPALKRYVDLKRALGRRFDEATRTLQLLDRFLQDQTIRYPDLNAAAFQAWCQTQEHLASGVRRGRMREVYNFCLYRLRTEPQCFVPDPVLFPKPDQRLHPTSPPVRIRVRLSLWQRWSFRIKQMRGANHPSDLGNLDRRCSSDDQIYLYDAMSYSLCCKRV